MGLNEIHLRKLWYIQTNSMYLRKLHIQKMLMYLRKLYIQIIALAGAAALAVSMVYSRSSR
jgi:hypothetical protein